jgi:hypothetical protein
MFGPPTVLYIKYPNDIEKAVGKARRHALRRRLVNANSEDGIRAAAAGS